MKKIVSVTMKIIAWIIASPIYLGYAFLLLTLLVVVLISKGCFWALDKTVKDGV